LGELLGEVMGRDKKTAELIAWGVNFDRLVPASWQRSLADELRLPYVEGLRTFLAEQAAAGKAIYPPAGDAFTALACTPPSAVKVVVLGQDPYHGEGQAHGLSFSVPEGVKIPPSLVNIYKELERDLGVTRPSHGNLRAWAEQGVLLLNATLSVEAGCAGSHQKQGWEELTDAIIDLLNQQREGLVFILWGAYAQKKGALIDRQKHCVLSSVHPSPLSAHRGFLGSGHFSSANDYLKSQGQAEIDWCIPEAEFKLV